MLVDEMHRDLNLNFQIAGQSSPMKTNQICHHFFNEHKKKDTLISCHF